MPRGRRRAGTQSRMQAEGKQREGMWRREGTWKEINITQRHRACLYTCVCLCLCVRVCECTNLRRVDSSLLEGTAGGVMGTQVAILAPVAAEGTVHTWQTPARIHTNTHTERERAREKKKQHSQGRAASLPKWGSATEEMSSDPKWAPAVVVPLWLAQYLLATRPSSPAYILYCLILILRVMCERQAEY